ncbi:MAG TPA: NAD(P)/FAD-dependent oxidoreductase [Gemmatimonadaceae bacterium]|nr:NAD(P)/FAD-dependent oxidoreductase [Gemmatimonadaceae bacterium]
MSDASGDSFEPYDVAIVGGGPAGLTAGIWSARYLHRTVVIDSGDPRNWETRGINGYLGHAGITPPELRGIGRDECRKYGAALLDALVLTAEKVDDDHFSLAIEGGERVHARRLLLAYGLRDVWPDIPGLARVYGANAHVCPDCDGYESRGRKVVVIGSGRRAVGMALNLTTWTDQIIICTNGKPPEMDAEHCEKLDALNIPVLTPSVNRVCYEGSSITCLELENGMQLDAEKIFFTLAQYPSDDVGAQLGCERDEGGHIIVDDGLHTSVRHVYAAGDLIPGPQLAIAAAADGAIAALHMHKSLVPEGRKLVPRD